MYLAGDIGGTTGRVAAYENLDSTIEIGRETFPMSDYAEASPKDFEREYDRLLGRCRSLAAIHGRIQGVGLAVAGKVNDDRTDLTMAGNLKHWVGQRASIRLGLALDCPVVLGNDAEAAALAEAKYGLGASDYKNVPFMGMIWGTGVGGACVRYLPDGRLLPIPCEPGHVTVDRNSVLKCRGCDDPGHLEAFCGGSNLPARFGVSLPEYLTPLQWCDVANDMLVGLKTILRLQPVGLITFSGGIACSQEWLLPMIQEELASPTFGSPEIKVSAFGESAGTLGALSLFAL